MADGDIPALIPDVQWRPSGYSQPKLSAASRALYEEVRPSIVQVRGVQPILNTLDTEGKRGAGSGFFADADGTVITDAHVVLNNRELYVTGADGKKYRARIDRVDDVNDLAVLKLEGFKPGTSKPLRLGSSADVLPDDEVYAFGHPHGDKATFISPGYHRFNSTVLNALVSETSKQYMGMALRTDSLNMTPSEFQDYRTALTKPLLHGHVHLEPGNSGGPLIKVKEVNGVNQPEVVGVSQSILASDVSMAYFTPPEDINTLLRSPKKFEMGYDYEASPLAEHYMNAWRHNKVLATAETTGVGLLTYGGAKVAQRFPTTGRLLAGGYGITRLMDNAPAYFESTNNRDATKYGIAAGSDLLMVAGTVASLIPKVRSIGKIAMALGFSGDIASGFIPNHLVMTDIRRTDGSLRPPFIMDRNLHLRDFSMSK